MPRPNNSEAEIPDNLNNEGQSRLAVSSSQTAMSSRGPRLQVLCAHICPPRATEMTRRGCVEEGKRRWMCACMYLCAGRPSAAAALSTWDRVPNVHRGPRGQTNKRLVDDELRLDLGRWRRGGG